MYNVWWLTKATDTLKICNALPFHGDNGYWNLLECYVIHTLSVLLCNWSTWVSNLIPAPDGRWSYLKAKCWGVWWLCRRIAHQHNTHITIFNRVLVVQFGVTTILLLYVMTISLRNSLLNESVPDYSSRYLLRTTAWFFLMCHQHFYSFRMPIFTKPSQRSNWGRRLARSAIRRPPVC